VTASTKFEIDIADAAACESGLKAVFEAMEQLHGARLAGQILTRALRDEAVRGACLGIKPAHLGLLLAYYQMPKPSKRALAAKLARINGNSNPPAYGTTGSDKASVLLR
jgi:hypothetical protein